MPPLEDGDRTDVKRQKTADDCQYWDDNAHCMWVLCFDVACMKMDTQAMLDKCLWWAMRKVIWHATRLRHGQCHCATCLSKTCNIHTGYCRLSTQAGLPRHIMGGQKHHALTCDVTTLAWHLFENPDMWHVMTCTLNTVQVRMPVCLHACSKQKTVISKQANLKYLDASAACSSITGASHCTLNLPEERMPFLWALIHPATLQQDSHCACKLLLHQVRMLAGVPASSMNVLGANRNGLTGAHM
jgi:hypothetical protein